MGRFQSFRLDTANQCLWHGDARADLTPKAFDVLRYLVEPAGRLVTPDELLEALWPDTYINPEGLRKYIQEIRSVLGDHPDKPVFIETLPKRGYQFIAPVIETYEALAACAAHGGLIDAEVRALIGMADPLAWNSSQRALEVLERALGLSPGRKIRCCGPRRVRAALPSACGKDGILRIWRSSEVHSRSFSTPGTAACSPLIWPIVASQAGTPPNTAKCTGA